MAANTPLRLSDYTPPEFTTDNVKLDIYIEDDGVRVESEVKYYRTNPLSKNQVETLRKRNQYKGPPQLVLNTANPNKDKKFLQALSLNGQPADKSVISFKDGDILIPMFEDEKEVTVKATTFLEPEANTRLLGLYQSDQCYITQCESDGFRSITPFLDHPDVMATYDVTVHADGKKFPVLLSNGHLIKSGKDKDGKNFATFNDPVAKPSYLFALAAGKFDSISRKHTTPSGREVDLNIYTEPGKADRARHALWALKQYLLFDEKFAQREYKHNVFNIVAVSKFTYGAMENPTLNVFRDSLILASPDTAEDSDYQRISDVINHEGDHYITGDLVTVRDWHNLAVKEGLTVFREQTFTASITSDDWERIRSVNKLRNRQFLEDDGPMAMPVVPKKLEALNNIYNGTTYDKGAEVVRLMMTLMGEKDFFKGFRDYIETYQGKAVTFDQFVDKMNEHTDVDLSGQFKLWYNQSGRPRVTAKVTQEWDNDSKTYKITLEQNTPPTADQKHKKAQFIPVKMALVDADGNDLPLYLEDDRYDDPTSGATERVLHFTGEKQTFVFTDLEKPPAFHSLFRDFSAPVTFDNGLSDEQRQQQINTDNNMFCRWDAVQTIAMNEMKRLYKAYKETGKLEAVSNDLLDTYRTVLADTDTHPAISAQIVTLPTIVEFESAVSPANPAAISAVMGHITKTIGRKLYREFMDTFDRTNENGVYSSHYDSAGKRALKNAAVSYMLSNGGEQNIKTAAYLYNQSNNMTDRMIYMRAINNHPGKERDSVMESFYKKFKDDSLVIQKWFRTQGEMKSDKVFETLDKITKSKVFNWENPGHAQSLYGGFVSNYEQFHRVDGKGYEHLANMITTLDKINGATASRFVGFLAKWKDYDGENREKMIEQLQRLDQTKNLSAEVRELVSKALPEEPANDNKTANKKRKGPDSRPKSGLAP